MNTHPRPNRGSTLSVELIDRIEQERRSIRRTYPFSAFNKSYFPHERVGFRWFIASIGEQPEALGRNASRVRERNKAQRSLFEASTRKMVHYL